MTGATDVRCLSCQAPLRPGDRFCERCGARLQDEEPPRPDKCQICGAATEAIDDDGYCSVCGARRPSASDRVELETSNAAAISDRGRVHRRNEDAVGLEDLGRDGAAAVICDGISSASAGDVAARSAAGAAIAVLRQALTDPGQDGAGAVTAAIAAASDAVAFVPWTSRADRGTPACTLVCAIWHGGELAIGSVGDSRAYWIGAEGARQLTVDDSWAEEQAAQGLLSFEQALDDPRSHAITHWIGADAPEREARVCSFRPDGPGRLLLCSDGLWNYVPTTAELGDLVGGLPSGASPAAVARALTETAILRGGRDNVTVAVVELDPSPGSAR